MNNLPSVDVTQILAGWSDDESGVPACLMPLVYDELRRLAANYLRRERSRHTLQRSALVPL